MNIVEFAQNEGYSKEDFIEELINTTVAIGAIIIDEVDENSIVLKQSIGDKNYSIEITELDSDEKE